MYMRKIEKEELKQIQLNILDEVDCFCHEHNIRYSMSCGTMLGAIRHGGYIPWDDDIDIYMLREDYDRFEAIFPQIYKDHLAIFSLKRRKDSTYPFIKVYDIRTICHEKYFCSVNPGVNIDVFPIDDVPDNDTEWECYNMCRRKLMLDLRHSGLRLSRVNSFVKNCGAIVYWFKYFFTNRRKLVEQIDDLAQVHNGNGYKRGYECATGVNMKQPFRKSLFDDLIDYHFENRVYKGFKDYDEFLTATFGSSYMTPPPPKKRISYHTFDAYWK